MLALLLTAHLVSAQGVLTMLNTGAGQPVVSLVRPVFVDAALVQPRFQFSFGFATDESFVPNTFLDSFTVTIQSSNQVFTAVGSVKAWPSHQTMPLAASD